MGKNFITAWEWWESGKKRRAEILTQNPTFGKYFILSPSCDDMREENIVPLTMVWAFGKFDQQPEVAAWVKETGSSARIVKGHYDIELNGVRAWGMRVQAIVFDTAEDMVAFQNEWVA